MNELIANLMFGIVPILSAALLIFGVMVLAGVLVLSAKVIGIVILTTAAVLFTCGIYLAIRHCVPPAPLEIDAEEDIDLHTGPEQRYITLAGSAEPSVHDPDVGVDDQNEGADYSESQYLYDHK